MRKKYFILSLLWLSAFPLLKAQDVPLKGDDIQRGYYNHPYLRYEAEEYQCETTGSFLQPSYDQRQLQSEASNQSAVQLIAKESYVQWTNQQAADGLTIRFSLPDNAEGKGTTGNLALYVNGELMQNVTLNSYWAWQYILKTGSKYPDNLPDASNKFPRMRFDEIHVRLAGKIPANAAIRLVKTDDNQVPYTIDFIELEEIPSPVTFESIADANKIAYSPDNGKLQYFVNANKGKTIYLPAGRYEVDNRIIISGDGTKIIGAGMWYTEIYFTASSDERGTYNQRGIESSSNNIVLEGLFLNTVNNKRYYNNNPIYQVGKGLMGSFGANSSVRNLWIEHFECGAWIEGANHLTIEHSRFRNNYADGINLAYGCTNSTVEYASFRNNGDDDIASWSRGDRMCQNNSFRYLTSENNWRASGLGFFGGQQNKAYNIVITDPMEAGFRVTCDFPGMPFSNEGYSEFYNISVYKGGVAAGTVGVAGDLWGNQQGALHINSSSQYDLQNIMIYNIDFYDSKNDAVFIGSGTKIIKNLRMKDINIHGSKRYGLYFYNPKGSATYCNVQYENIGAATNTNAIPSSFIFSEDCSTAALPTFKLPGIQVTLQDGGLLIKASESDLVEVYDVWGRKYDPSFKSSQQAVIPHLRPGIYILRWNNQSMKVAVQ